MAMKQEDGDVTAWVNTYGDNLYRFARIRLRDHDIAEDMVQETFLAAWKARDNFKGESTRKTWLIGILKHKIIDHIRKQVRNRKLDTELSQDPTSPLFNANQSWRDANHAWLDSPDKLFQDGEFRDALEQCLQHLPLRQRQIFVLREFAGEDAESICNSCEVTSTNLHVLMHRARLSLRKCLEKHGFGAKS